jgi:GAF domain-containing protein
MIDPRRPGAYGRLFVQLSDLVVGKSPNLVAAMATVAALLQAKLRHHSWTGFYFVAAGPEGDAEPELHVGPYQGPLACQTLRGRGVCLAAVKAAEAVVVPDVRAFPGHIACDERSRSEIVVPLVKDGRVVAVLDVDSTEPAQFDADDAAELAKIVALLEPFA